MEQIKQLQGEKFNKLLIEAPLNNSQSKQSFAFSKAKRFSNVSVNSQGFAISMLGTDDRSKTPGHRSMKKSSIMNGCYLPNDSDENNDYGDYGDENDVSGIEDSHEEQTNLASPKRHPIKLTTLNDSSDVNLLHNHQH